MIIIYLLTDGGEAMPRDESITIFSRISSGESDGTLFKNKYQSE